MIERAKVRGMIAYSDLVKRIKSIRIEAHDPRLFELAKQLGRNTSNIPKCWVDELHKVHAVWSGK